jgi:hypothetical protein
MRIVLPHERAYPEPVVRVIDAAPAAPLVRVAPRAADRAGPPRAARRAPEASAPGLAAGPRKIPGQCPLCGNALRRSDMECFLERCEQLGRDPIALALASEPPGVACLSCQAVALAEQVEDGGAAALELVARMRAMALADEEAEGEAPARRQGAAARAAARP